MKETERLEEALDAVADLMLAESAHQAVQSNIDRARGVLRAMGEGELPPIPEVAQTPRTGRVFTQRVVLHLPFADTGATPRARANPALNAWLAQQLPPLDKIGFEVRPSEDAQTTTFDDTGLEPIDLVLMSADRFGDGTSDLERYLADKWRGDNDVPDEVETLFAGPAPPSGKLVIDLGAASNATPIGRLLPQLRALRRLLGGGRGAHAQDLRRAEDDRHADPSNPKGYALVGDDLAVLPRRIDEARQGLYAGAQALDAHLASFMQEYNALRANAAGFDATFWESRLATLRALMRALALYATPEAVPRSSSGETASSVFSLVEQARVALTAIGKRLDAAEAALVLPPLGAPLEDPKEEARRSAGRLSARFDNLSAAAQLALGGNFPLQPVFALAADAQTEIAARLADPIEKDPLAIEGWLQSLARVRPPIADLALASAAALWVREAEPRFAPVQLPLRAGDPWIGQAWTTPPQDGEILSVMTVDAPASLSGELEAVLLDEWTETVPTLNETAGVAFHFDRPSAAAPQALLLAAPAAPDGRWRWSELLGVVTDTFARARLRAIEPDQIAASPLFPVLPMTLTSFVYGSPFASTFLLRDTVELAIAPE